MSAQANIVAFDGAATPVSHLFAPAGVERDLTQGLVAEWREMLSAVPIYAQPRLTTYKKVLKSGIHRVELRVSVPVMESVSGQNSSGYTAAPKVAYENTAAAVCYFNERATVAERRLVRGILANVLNNVSTTVVAATSGVASELIDSDVVAS